MTADATRTCFRGRFLGKVGIGGPGGLDGCLEDLTGWVSLCVYKVGT